MFELFPKFDKFEKCPGDKIFIEDKLGRVEILIEDTDLIYDIEESIVSEAKKSTLINGLTVAIEGIFTHEHKIQVSKVILPGLTKSNTGRGLTADKIAPQLPHNQCSDIKQLTNSTGKKNLVALVSGLELDSTKDISKVRTLADSLVQAEDIGLPHINNLMILGDSLNIQQGINLNLVGSYTHESKFKDMFVNVKDTAQVLDNCLLQIGQKMNIVMLPGDKDPCDSFMP